MSKLSIEVIIRVAQSYVRTILCACINCSMALLLMWWQPSCLAFIDKTPTIQCFDLCSYNVNGKKCKHLLETMWVQ